ncbi:MAG: DUF3127 domain-containing protein [Bacteroidales bacterium]|nr:DUF3127 domain-containing protein [Bacteroidales bacterium]
MELTGKLIKILPETRGESQRGPWVRGGFVIESDGDYPRQVAFTTFGEDRLSMVQSIPLNSPVIVNFTIESREFNERWYTDCRASRVQSYVPGQMPSTAAGYGYPPVQPMQTPQVSQPVPPVVSPTPFAAAPTPASTMPSGASMPQSDDDLPF